MAFYCDIQYHCSKNVCSLAGIMRRHHIVVYIRNHWQRGSLRCESTRNQHSLCIALSYKPGHMVR
jgi:hypothetical protein